MGVFLDKVVHVGSGAFDRGSVDALERVDEVFDDAGFCFQFRDWRMKSKEISRVIQSDNSKILQVR